eukprot:COSAG05_NODE_9968_length_590_cov_0.942974_1_plen_67_part_10
MGRPASPPLALRIATPKYVAVVCCKTRLLNYAPLRNTAPEVELRVRGNIIGHARTKYVCKYQSCTVS